MSVESQWTTVPLFTSSLSYSHTHKIHIYNTLVSCLHLTLPRPSGLAFICLRSYIPGRSVTYPPEVPIVLQDVGAGVDVDALCSTGL